MTTGGSTSGRWTMPFRSDFPQKRPRARSMRNERCRAAGSPTIAQSGDLEAQPNRRPLFRAESTQAPDPCQAEDCESLFLESGFARLADSCSRGTPPRPGSSRRHQRDRIDDRRMRCPPGTCRRFSPRIGGGVGLVDDAERRLAARDQGERGTNVVGLRDLAGDASPIRRASRAPPCRICRRERPSTFAHRELAVAEQPGEVEIGLDRRASAFESFGAISTMRCRAGSSACPP